MSEPFETIYALAVLEKGDILLATAAGLLRSSDRGTTWADAYGDLFGGAPMPTTCLTVQQPHEIIFAGAPGGILSSLDGGLTWHIARLPEPPPLAAALAASPNFTEDHSLFAATVEDGVFCSRDGGGSFQAWNFGLFDPNLYALAVSPDFAADRTLYAASSTGLFVSANGGYSWQPVHEPAVARENAVISLAMLSSQALLAGFEGAGLFVSRDGTRSWMPCAGLPAGQAPSYILPDPAHPGTVYCLCGGVIFRSRDAGVSFSASGGEGASAICLSRGELWAASEERGVWKASSG